MGVGSFQKRQGSVKVKLSDVYKKIIELLNNDTFWWRKNQQIEPF